MTFLALRTGLPVRAAAAFGAITDLEAFLGVDGRAVALGPQIWPDLATNRAQITEGRSAQRWPEGITAPILLMHGADDRQSTIRTYATREPETGGRGLLFASSITTVTRSSAIVSNAIARRPRSSSSSCPASRNGERRRLKPYSVRTR